jgi:hypothetical protein
LPSTTETAVEVLNSLCDIGDRAYQLRRIQDILSRGLGDRILQMRIISSADREWAVNKNVIYSNPIYGNGLGYQKSKGNGSDWIYTKQHESQEFVRLWTFS